MCMYMYLSYNERPLLIFADFLIGTCSNICEQLRLALMWDREDLAEDYILDGEKAQIVSTILHVYLTKIIDNTLIDFQKLLL